MKHTTASNRFLLFSMLLTCIGFVSCSKDDEPAPAYTMEQLYANSIADAMIADSSEVVDSLWPITAENTRLQWKTINGQSYVLMATFMRFPDSYPEGDSITNTWGDAWLFIPAQMKSRIGQTFNASSDTTMRICQLLGLPPKNSRSNTHIAEIWVPAARLNRPAGNPSIVANTTGAALVSTVPPAYATWFNNYIIYAYYHTLTSATDFHYPWTRLGYTYDWAPGSKEVGLSEYVLQASSGCWVEKVRTSADYFR
ncbi:hypothetical protein [Chitinophaga rhizophila]|uniref:Heme-binding HmuY-like protein n=1 Tax=Chitinophaga rhizophila TaxID=2866212 RepID=A0ABS7GC40_9BACT|nr:hypothetical protein [Chitinophaga rhizophila]MBW8685242.1 hypothetical protein [Chitinophaga rhizophila]